jgi:molybdate transport system substrate-binding protein
MNKYKFIAIIAFVSFVFYSNGQQPDRILVAAASDLKFALDSVAKTFKAIHPGTVDITYGSSGKLSEQILNGAPFDLFFSADITYPNQLKEKGFASSEVYPYAIGRIVLWSKKIDPRKEEMKSLLDPFIKKVAIANPVHAPYGKRAEEALRYYKMLDNIKGQLVYGENISQTAQYVTSGAADIGIIALSLALSPNMKREGGKYFVIPEISHEPLLQGFVVTSRARGNELAVTFQQFVRGDKGNAILRYFGFTKP